MDIEKLKEYLAEGKSTNEIAPLMGLKSGSTVRFWMKKYGLTPNSNKGGRQATHAITNDCKICLRCNNEQSISQYRKRNDRNSAYSPYCRACEAKDTYHRYDDIKRQLVEFSGGKCKLCEQTYPIAVYSFHHTGKEHKDFNLADKRHASLESSLRELKKCILVCRNCHAEIHEYMKKQEGYQNKIKGNSEAWNNNKKRKLDFIGKNSCEKCNYDIYQGNLCVVFPDELKHYKKYNRTHWDKDFENALTRATILCQNCIMS